MHLKSEAYTGYCLYGLAFSAPTKQAITNSCMLVPFARVSVSRCDYCTLYTPNNVFSLHFRTSANTANEANRPLDSELNSAPNVFTCNRTALH